MLQATENEDQSAHQISLEKVLSDAGLDTEYWFEKIKSGLGITLKAQLKFVTQAEIEDLKKHIRFKWEQNALLEIFSLPDKTGKQQKQSAENTDRSYCQISLEEALTNAGLEPKDWLQKFESELGIRSTRQLQFMTQKDFEKLIRHAKHSWEPNAIQQMCKLEENTSRKQNIALEKKDQLVQKVSLEETLTNGGLDSKFWSEKFKTELGIILTIQLTSVTKNDLEALLKHTRYKWEPNALRAVLKLEDNVAELQKNATEIMTEAMKKLPIAGKDTVNILEELSKRLDQPMDQRYFTAEKDSIKPADKMLEELNKRSEVSYQHVEAAETRRSKSKLDQIDPSFIIGAASGGTILRGTLVTKNIDDILVKRRQLIQLLGKAQFSGSDIPATTEEVEFYSKEKSDLFSHYLETSGIHFALSKVLGHYGATCTSGASLKIQSEKEKIQENKVDETFSSRIRCYVFPIHSVQLTPKTLGLSDEALESLQYIEQQIIASTENEQESMCTDFFLKYGSHINTGLVHLGGIYIWETTFHGTTSASHEQISTMCMTLNNAFAEAGHSGFSHKAGVAMTAEALSKSTGKSCQFSEADIAQTRLSCRMYGGSPLASSLQEWKTSLWEDEETWIVIDKVQNCDFNYIGVWELIKNQSILFKDSDKLSTALVSAYSKLTDVSIESKEIAVYSYDQFSSNIKHIIVEAQNPGRLINYCDALEKLVAEVEKLEKNVGSAKAWVRLLQRDDYISDFLLFPTSHLKCSYIKNSRLRLIRQDVGRLMKPAKSETETDSKIARIFDMINSESLGSSVVRYALSPVLKPITDFVDEYMTKE